MCTPWHSFGGLKKVSVLVNMIFVLIVIIPKHYTSLSSSFSSTLENYSLSQWSTMTETKTKYGPIYGNFYNFLSNFPGMFFSLFSTLIVTIKTNIFFSFSFLIFISHSHFNQYMQNRFLMHSGISRLLNAFYAINSVEIVHVAPNSNLNVSIACVKCLYWTSLNNVRFSEKCMVKSVYINLSMCATIIIVL